MPILSARHKCPKCGREWMMPVNTLDLSMKDGQKAMLERKDYLPTACEGCRERW